MTTTSLNPLSRLPAWVHFALLLASIAAIRTAKTKLDLSYAASRHPVDFVTGQTSFSGETIKEYYAIMQSHGTLPVYWQTQIIDFAFIASVFAIGFFASTFILRFTKQHGFAAKVAMGSGIFLMCGALCDAIENLISFVMLSKPDSFANWIAVPYSGFAMVKFSLITLGMLCLILSCLMLLIELFRSTRNTLK